MKTMLSQMKNRISALCRRAHSIVQNDSGAETLEVVFMAAIGIVVLVVIFFPMLRELVTGAFDNAGSMLDSIWGYKG